MVPERASGHRPGRPASVVLLIVLLLSSVAVAAVDPTPRHALASRSAFGSVSSDAPSPPPPVRVALHPVVGPPVKSPALVGPSWINITQAQPNPRLAQGYGRSEASDPLDHVTLLFGGCLPTQCPSAQTWLFAHGSWVNTTNPHDAPPAREFASMDFDANMQGVLLFGGRGANSTLLNDTWLYQGGTWTNVTAVGGGPAPREGASLAFDPEPEENGSVLFGGCVPGLVFSCFNDTWVWKSWSGWVPLSPSAPPLGVAFPAMAYDPASGHIVLFGGCAGFVCLGAIQSTYELYSGQWWQIQPTGPPVNRSQSSMVYVPSLQRLVLFGGFNQTVVPLGDTWEFYGGSWQLLSAAGGPSARGDSGLSLDPTGQTPILVGGESVTPALNDTWAYEVAPSATLIVSGVAAETSQPVTFTARVQGGTPPYSALFTFGDGTSQLVVANGPTITASHAYLTTGSFAGSLNVTDSVGVVSAAPATTVVVSAGLAITAAANPGSADAGSRFTFSGLATSPGTPPVGYTWQFGDSSSGTGGNVNHSYPSAGKYRVNVTAVDARGASADYSLEVAVAPLPTITLAQGLPAPAAGHPDPFYANVSGGTAPFFFAWQFGEGGSSAGAAPAHVFAQPGTYSVTVWVNDSGGGAVKGSISVSVSPAPSGSSSSGAAGGPPVWYWPALIGLILAGAVGAVVLARSRRPPAAPKAS
ncbi:MAG: PKD domain-containing protein [Thermoplasmata archaeon]|nr:PKD domain-containing protein [Thermoplasmata archaeon]MCI4359756.1 PKD domain-containing protein [Thermoplasmata archaeon]